MTPPSVRTAVVVAPSGSEPLVDRLAGDLHGAGWQVDAMAPDRRSGARRLAPARRARLVVADLTGPHRSRTLWAGAAVARVSAAPLIVVEDPPGTLARLRGSRPTRWFTDRLVSRTLAPAADGRPLLGPDLLEDIGLGSVGSGADSVAPLTIDDLDDVVRIHREAFPTSAMTVLGDRVVERYYRWQFTGAHPAPYATGVRRDGRLVGFVFGGLRRDAVSGFARRFLPTVALAVVRHPSAAPQLAGADVGQVLRLMFRGRSHGLVGDRPDAGLGPGGGSGMAATPSFGILAIAVAPSAQGSGAADDLMAAAEQRAVDLTGGRMHLTVHTDNDRAIRFYERRGWARDPDLDGSWQGRMARRVAVDEAQLSATE